MVEEGKPAPDFELATDEGEKVKLSDIPRTTRTATICSNNKPLLSRVAPRRKLGGLVCANRCEIANQGAP